MQYGGGPGGQGQQNAPGQPGQGQQQGPGGGPQLTQAQLHQLVMRVPGVANMPPAAVQQLALQMQARLQARAQSAAQQQQAPGGAMQQQQQQQPYQPPQLQQQQYQPQQIQQQQHYQSPQLPQQPYQSSPQLQQQQYQPSPQLQQQQPYQSSPQLQQQPYQSSPQQQQQQLGGSPDMQMAQQGARGPSQMPSQQSGMGTLSQQQMHMGAQPGPLQATGQTQQVPSYGQAGAQQGQQGQSPNQMQLQQMQMQMRMQQMQQMQQQQQQQRSQAGQAQESPQMMQYQQQQQQQLMQSNQLIGQQGMGQQYPQQMYQPGQQQQQQPQMGGSQQMGQQYPQQQAHQVVQQAQQMGQQYPQQQQQQQQQQQGMQQQSQSHQQSQMMSAQQAGQLYPQQSMQQHPMPQQQSTMGMSGTQPSSGQGYMLQHGGPEQQQRLQQQQQQLFQQQQQQQRLHQQQLEQLKGQQRLQQVGSQPLPLPAAAEGQLQHSAASAQGQKLQPGPVAQQPQPQPQQQPQQPKPKPKPAAKPKAPTAAKTVQTPAKKATAKKAASKRMGLTPEQITCLKTQIAAFKCLKRGETNLPEDILKGIIPPELPPPPPPPKRVRKKVPAAPKAIPAAKPADPKPQATKQPFKQATPPKPAVPAAPPKPTKEQLLQAHRHLTRSHPPLASVQCDTDTHGTPSPYGAMKATASGTSVPLLPKLLLGEAEMMKQELSRQIKLRKEKKIASLEAALAKEPTGRATYKGGLPQRGSLQLQLRMLRLMERQAALRVEVEEAQGDIISMNERTYKKHVRQLDKQSLDLAKAVDKSKSERTNLLYKSLRSWKSDMQDRFSAQKELRIVRSRAMLRAHDRFNRGHTKSKEDDRTRRMEALKANDLEAYQELIRSQSGAQTGEGGDKWHEISKFLQDTERYLDKLGSKLASVKVGQEAQEAAEQAAAEARAAGLPEEEIKSLAAAASVEAMANSRVTRQANQQGGDAQSRYYALAHSIEEKVLTKPSLLKPPNNGSLREYQMLGLSWMVSLYNNHLNGILADEMGLGKTVQVMALIAYLMEFKGNYGPHLIIVPNAVLVNWKSELQTWLPSVKCVYYVGHKDERARKFVQDVLPMQFNVLVTTYEFIMRDRSKLSRVDWKYIIIDEAQRMKDRSSKLAKDLDRYTAARRLLLTGTPLQNELAELWSLLNLLLPDVFDDNKGFTEWFSDSINSGNDNPAEEWLAKEKRVVVIHRLHQILEPFMLRRQVTDVETKLPPKVAHTVKCAMTPYQEGIYKWVKSTGTVRIDPAAKQGKIQREYAALNNRVMELRKVCNHPLLSYPPFFVEPLEWVTKCGKMMVLDRLLVKLFHTEHRVLLFSTMTKLLDILESYLKWRVVDTPKGRQQMKYSRIDGSTSLEDREASIQEFRKPDSETFIFLLSIRAAGRGLNLQTSDTVIIYDPDHNPKNEEQAIARAHRIGQTKEVRVLFMESVPEAAVPAVAAEPEKAAPEKRYADSIESLIRNNIQKMKIDMANEVIDAGRFDGQTTNDERKQTLETLLQDEERNAKATNEVPTWPALNRMVARSEEEAQLYDKLDKEMEWPPIEGLEAIPDWLGYTHEELQRVSQENRPSTGGLDAREEKKGKKKTPGRRGRPPKNPPPETTSTATPTASASATLDKETDEPGAVGEDDDEEEEVPDVNILEDEPEDEIDMVMEKEDSRGHTWDTPGATGVTGSAWVEDGPELVGPRTSSKGTADDFPTTSIRSDLHAPEAGDEDSGPVTDAQPPPAVGQEAARLKESKEERKAKKRMRHDKEGKPKKHHKEKDKRKDKDGHKAKKAKREETPASSVGTGVFKFRLGMGRKPTE